MRLITYSDSEASDTEASDTEPIPVSTPKPSGKPASKPASKHLPRTASNKIKLDLPAFKPEPGAQQEPAEPAPKRAKTAGAFSGFNSFLPPPKRTGQNAPKAGVSLKTSSEAAFSRTPAPRLADADAGVDVEGEGGVVGIALAGTSGGKRDEAAVGEVKPVGKPTRFMPLSVANAKKKKNPNSVPKPTPARSQSATASDQTGFATVQEPEPHAAPVQPKIKPKSSLFSFSGQDAAPAPILTNTYEPELLAPETAALATPPAEPTPNSTASAPAQNPNTLSSLASDLNLTPAQKRQLFGRQNKDAETSIAHFNMDAEYKANQQLAASGEAFEHRAVKTISAGKHSLQQLVNNVKGQTEALEDKWAEGRRARGEGGSKYGWGK